MENRKAETISFRTTSVAKKMLENRAKQMSMNISEYLLYALLARPIDCDRILMLVLQNEKEISSKLDMIYECGSVDAQELNFAEIRNAQQKIKLELLSIANKVREG